MILFAADENFNNDIIRGLLRKNSDIDIVRIQDIGLRTAGDKEILERCAKEERVILTHDAATMIKFGFERIEAGLPMPGMIVVPLDASFKSAIENLLLAVECGRREDFENRVIYLPFK